MSPETATIAIDDTEADDVVFTVTCNTTNEIVGLKIGGTAVNASNYTIDEDTKMEIAIKATYLHGLTAGNKNFTILMDKGFDIPVVIAVTETTE